MEITLLFLPLVATFLLLTDFKEPTNRWGSLTLLLISLGGFYSLTDHFFAVILKEIVNPNLIRLLSYFFVFILFKTPLCLFPFAMIMFAFHYCHSDDRRNQSQKSFLLLVLLIPIAIMYLIPLNPFDFSSLRRFLTITDLWALPYMAMAYYFLYKSIVCCDRRLETDRILTVMTIGVVSLLYLIVVYLLPLDRYEIFKFNPHFVIGFLGFFSFFSIKYGFLGFKVSVGNIYLDNAIKTVSSGVSVINRHIKNKLLEISASASDINAALGQNRNLIVLNSNSILSATDEISIVVERLHHYLNKIDVNPIQLNLTVIVNEVVVFFESQIQEKALLVRNDLSQEIIIRGDRFYLVEALKNIFQNSLEAMKKGDCIQIDLLHSQKNVTLMITDTGCGISPKDLPHVVEPFYTTKDPGRHFGLGLSYCYNIMQQHGGLLEIESIENAGTTVFLKFPFKNNCF